MLTLLSLAALAAPVDATLGVDPLTLADGRIPVVDGRLPDIGEVPVDVLYDGIVVDAPCRVRVAGGAIARLGEAASCPALWTLTFPATPDSDGGVVGLRLAHEGRTWNADGALPAPARVVPARLESGAVKFDSAALPGVVKLAVADPAAGWVIARPLDGVAPLSLAQGLLTKRGAVLAYARHDGALVALVGEGPEQSMAPIAKAPAADGPPPAEVQTTLTRGDVTTEDWCPVAGKDEVVLCWDLTGPGPEVTSSTRRQVIKPDTEVVVRVKHFVDQTVTLSQKGHAGVTRRGVREADDAEFNSRDTDKPTTVTPRDFAPRRPGDASVLVTLGSGEVLTHELVVQQTYNGALRTGIAFVGGGAVDADYAAATLAGASTQEVVATSRGGADVELVVGFAPFLDPGGRPANGCEQAPLCFAPYVGLGVVAPSASGLDVLKSVHVGAEWEPVSSFSLSATLVTRRVTRLADGVHVGSPTQGAPATTEGWGLGAGVVLNVTPSFFKLASKGVVP